jgi:serine protease Do
MKRISLRLTATTIAMMMLAPAAIQAQKTGKEEKDKELSSKKNVEQIIITKRGDSKEKVVVEINGDKVTVNGKPIEDIKDGDISVNVHDMKGLNSLRTYSNNGNWNYNWNDNNAFMDENTPMLGVTTERVDEGVEVSNVTDESGADKAGLKEGDIITRVDDKKMEDPDDLTKIVRAHKPGDKIAITYLRDKKENKVTAELTKWKGFSIGRLEIPNMDMNITPRAQTMPRGNLFYNVGGRPKLGLSVQDTEDGKGVKVADVDEEGSAQKAGIHEDDVIIAINEKEVNSADEVAKIVGENKDKPSIMLRIKREGKIQNIEVKVPRKLKTANL